MLKSEEVRSQANAYINSQPSDNITTRRENAKLAAYEITATLFSVRNEVEQLEIERDFLLLLLKEDEHGRQAEDAVQDGDRTSPRVVTQG